MAKRYRAEEKWRDERYVPAKVKEHLQISVGSSACMHIVTITFILMGDIATREAIEWAFSYPEMIRAVCIVGRISNDIVSHEVSMLHLVVILYLLLQHMVFFRAAHWYSKS